MARVFNEFLKFFQIKISLGAVFLLGIVHWLGVFLILLITSGHLDRIVELIVASLKTK